MGSDFGLLVLSCDKYSHLWPATFECLRRNFSDCPWPIYLGSNRKTLNDPNITTLLSEDDLDWSSSLIKILEKFPHKKVFLILEDLLIASPISLEKCQKIAEFMSTTDAKHIKYWPYPKPDSPHSHPLMAVYEKGAPYRATVCGFWDVAYLKKLLIPGESPWNFEIMGSYRTSYTDGFYGLREPLFLFRNMIEKGKWFPESVAWAEKEGFDIGVSEKPILSGRNRLVSQIQILIFKMILQIPWRRRLRVMNFLRKLFICY